jgi:multidrug efflux pump subunit AcrA (membrane-fusion protein)
MMIDPKKLFREKAMKKASSPEQLDELIQVTDATGWLALITLTVLILVALVWGILGSIPTNTTGQGVFIRGGGFIGVDAPVAGELREINVTIGEVVVRGQRIGRIGGDTIPSPYAGRVAQILVDKGDQLSIGAPILSLEDKDAEMRAVAFIALADAKKILPGMKAQIAPSTVKKEDFGAIMGKISSVAQFPSTSATLKSILVNDELVETIASMQGPVEVQIELERDSHTASGFRWTSSSGPIMQISSGMLGYVTVTTSEQQPISLVLPWLKDLLK